MQKIEIFLIYLFILNTITLFPQTDKSLDFWPHHTGDTWQYRKMSTNQIDHTIYIDSIKYDPLTKNTIIYEGGWGNSFYNHYKIDSLGNVYSRGIDSEYIRYKLYADSGDTWTSGFVNSDTVKVKIFSVFNSTVFEINTNVKAYRFERYVSYLPNPTSLGDDYLAKGFGLIEIRC